MKVLENWERMGGNICVRLRRRVRTVAQVYAPSRHERGNAVDELEAIGDLIAAAPKMLAALKGMLRAYDFGEEFPPDHPVAVARAAVARARSH